MRMRYFYFVLAVLLPVTFAVSYASADTAITPGAFVKHLARKAFASANDRNLSVADRARGLDELLDTGFDMPQVARYVVGLYWQEASTDEQQAFTVAFRDYVKRTYVERFAEYKADTFRIVGQRNVNAASIVVSTEIDKTAEAETADRTSTDQPARIEWLVIAGDGYRIVDVTVGGVSIATTKHAEFLSYLRHIGGDLASLTQRLQATAIARQ